MNKTPIRIRYSETDLTGKLSMQGLLRLFQDMNYLYAEDAGRGIDYQAAHGAAWYLLSWDVHLCDAPLLSETVYFSSYFYQMTGALAKKYMTLTGEDGRVLAYALTRWAFVDIASGDTVPFPPHYWEGADVTPLPEGIKPSPRIPAPRGVALEPIVVGDVLIDENEHVNNVRFSELALTMVSKEVGSVALQAEFLRQTRRGDTLYPLVAKVGGRMVVSFRDAQGKPYANFAAK